MAHKFLGKKPSKNINHAGQDIGKAVPSPLPPPPKQDPFVTFQENKAK